MDLHNYLKEQRIKNSLTQEDASELIGVSKQTIQMWENSSKGVLPAKNYFKNIIDSYNLSAEEFKNIYSDTLFKDIQEEKNNFENKYKEYPFSEIIYDEYTLNQFKKYFLTDEEVELLKWLKFYNPNVLEKDLLKKESFKNLPFELVKKYGRDNLYELSNINNRVFEVILYFPRILNIIEKYKFKSFKFSYLTPEELFKEFGKDNSSSTRIINRFMGKNEKLQKDHFYIMNLYIAKYVNDLLDKNKSDVIFYHINENQLDVLFKDAINNIFKANNVVMCENLYCEDNPILKEWFILKEVEGDFDYENYYDIYVSDKLKILINEFKKVTDLSKSYYNL